MKIDWQAWEPRVEAVEAYVNSLHLLGAVMSEQNFEEVLKLLPNEYNCITIVGHTDDSGLNAWSVIGLVRCLPLIALGDYFVTSYTWDKQPHAGRFANLCLFKNNHRLLLSFADDTVFFKVSKRSGLHYKGFSSGEATIIDREDMGQIEKLVEMMED